MLTKVGLRKSPVIIGALAFKSFDTRFDDILTDLKYHQEILKFEIELLHLGLTHDEAGRTRKEIADAADDQIRRTREASERLKQNRDILIDIKADAQNVRQETTLRNIRSWLSAPEFAAELEEAFGHRENDTCNWIFDNAEYEEWRDVTVEDAVAVDQNVTESRILWIHGPPGSGKTVLAATILDDLLENSHDDEDAKVTVLYHFFKDSSEFSDPITSYRVMLAQALHQNRHDIAMIDRFVFAMDDHSSGQLTATATELLDLFNLCLDYLDKVYIVLDGIDECRDAEKLMDGLTHCACGERYPLLLLSRLNVAPLLIQIAEPQRITMSNGGVASDIRLYVKRKLEILKKQRLLPNDVLVGQLTDQLVKGAGHMFLWARLMVIFLKSPALTPKQRLRTISSISLPEGLDPMYSRIFSLIAEAPEPEIRLAMAILTWLAGTRRSISEAELQEALIYDRSEADFDENDGFEDFRYAVVMTCQGLVEPSSSLQNHPHGDKHFQFVHLSAKAFFLNLQPGSRAASVLPEKLGPYLQTTEEINWRIASVCLQYLSRKMPRGPLSGRIEKGVEITSLMTRLPLVSYASTWWVDHLAATSGTGSISQDSSACPPKNERSLFVEMQTFLSDSYVITAWIEASYYYQRWHDENSSQADRIDNLLGWCGAIDVDENNRSNPQVLATVQTCKEFCQDLRLLDQIIGDRLRESPNLMWNEATAFVPSRFWVTGSATSVELLDPQALNLDAISGRALATISESLLSHCLVGVLSIWPSR